jgi:hypothetical protein
MEKKPSKISGRVLIVPKHIIDQGRRVPTAVGARRAGFLMGRGWHPENSFLGAGEGYALSRPQWVVKGAMA